MYLEEVVIMLIALISGGIFSFFLRRRYEMSEKVDKGMEFCYWKLSYRRKFIRTLWLIPIYVIIIPLFYKAFHSDALKVIISVMVLSGILFQSIYNYIKWKKEL